MIVIIVFIVSLNAIHCQNETGFCELMKTNGRHEGIQVFRSSVRDEYVMYNNGNQWGLRFETTSLGMFFHKLNRWYNKQIVNRFSGNDYDCYVKYQAKNPKAIVTNCTIGKTDRESQFDAKAIIYRASKYISNDWVVIYRKNDSKISCYSPQETTQKLVTNETKCRELIGRNQTVIKAIDPLIVESIDGIVESVFGKSIVGYYLLFRRDGRPVFCDKSMFDPKNRCKEKTDITEKKTSPKDTK